MASLDAPSTFGQQVDAYGVFLATADDALRTVQGFDKAFFDWLTPVEAFLESQKEALGNAPQAMRGLAGRGGLHRHCVDVCSRHLPPAAVLSEASANLLGWKSQADVLQQSVAYGQSIATQPSQQKQLVAKQQLINAKADELRSRVNSIATTARQAHGDMGAIDGVLKTCAQQLNAVTDHSTLISGTALPAAAKLASTMRTIDSIFDPVQALLGALQCEKDSRNSKTRIQVS